MPEEPDMPITQFQPSRQTLAERLGCLATVSYALQREGPQNSVEQCLSIFAQAHEYADHAEIKEFEDVSQQGPLFHMYLPSAARPGKGPPRKRLRKE